MSEVEKKAKRPIDPNSAKYKLNQIIVKHYNEVNEAKAKGKKSDSVPVDFSQEIFKH